MQDRHCQTEVIEKGNDSQPPLHVDIIYAGTVHAFFPRELNDWTKRPSADSEVRAKECDVVMATCIPISSSRSCYNPSDRRTRKEEQGYQLW